MARPPARGQRGGSSFRAGGGGNNHNNAQGGSNQRGRGRGRGAPAGRSNLTDPSGLLQSHRDGRNNQNNNNGENSRERNNRLRMQRHQGLTSGQGQGNSDSNSNSRDSSPNPGRSDSPNSRASTPPHVGANQHGQSNRGRGNDRGRGRGSGSGRGGNNNQDQNQNQQNNQEHKGKKNKPQPNLELMNTAKARWEELKTARKEERSEYNAKYQIPDSSGKMRMDIDCTPMGTCTDMCPEFERVERVVQNLVDKCEKVQHPDSKEWMPAGERMVKRYKRSAAGDDDQLPSDIRTPETLLRTMNYLIEDVIGAEGRLALTHKFVWDRTRAIRNDFSVQQVLEEQNVKWAVECYEKAARFHVLSLHLLSSEEHLHKHENFDAPQDIEQLNATLVSLTGYYDSFRILVDFPNEAEFRAYEILLNIEAQKPDMEARMQEWPNSVLADERVQMANILYKAACNTLKPNGPLRPFTPDMVAQNSSAAFWDALASPSVSYLMACVAEITFYHVRFGALDSLWRSVKSAPKAQQEKTKEWTLREMTDYLAFDVDEQTEFFCAPFNLGFYETNDKGEKYLNFTRDPLLSMDLARNQTREFFLDDKDFVEKKMAHIPTKQVFSQSYVEEKRGCRNLASVIHGLDLKEAYELRMTVFDQEVEIGGAEEPVPEGESSMFFPETNQTNQKNQNSTFGTPQEQPASGFRVSAEKPVSTSFGRVLQGAQPFGDAVVEANSAPCVLSNSVFARPPSQQSNTPPVQQWGFAEDKLAPSTSKPEEKHVFGTTTLSPSRNVFANINNTTNPSAQIRNPFAASASASQSAPSFNNPFLQQSSQGIGLGGTPANSPFSTTPRSSTASATIIQSGFKTDSVFTRPFQPVAASFEPKSDTPFVFNNPFTKSSQQSTAPPAQPAPSFQSQGLFQSPLEAPSATSEQKPRSAFHFNQPSQSQTSSLSSLPTSNPAAASWIPLKLEQDKPFSFPGAASLQNTDPAAGQSSQDSGAPLPPYPPQGQGAKSEQGLLAATHKTAAPITAFNFQTPELRPPETEPPRQVFSFSTLDTQKISPQSPRKPAFPKSLSQPHAAPPIGTKATPARPAAPAFNSRPGPTSTPVPLSETVFTPDPPVSTTPPTSPPQGLTSKGSSAARRNEAIETTARLSLTQTDGLLQEYLEYSLGKFLPGIVEQHYTEVWRQKITRLKTNILARKFGRLWRRLAYENALYRRAKQRRQNFAQSLKMEAEQKRQKEEELRAIEEAVNDSRRVREEQRKSKKEAEKAKREDEANVTKSDEQPQLAGAKRKSLGEQSPKKPGTFQPYNQHKRSRTLGSSLMLPPPRTYSQPTDTRFKASIFSSGRSSYGNLSRPNSARDMGRSRSDNRTRQDETRTDFFKLVAHGVDPDTPLVPLTQSQVDAKARRVNEEREARLNAIYNRRKHKSAAPENASPAPQSPSAIASSSTRESTPRSAYDPDADEVIKQLRETRKLLAEGSRWFKEQTATLQQEEERLILSTSSQGSPRISVNGVEYTPFGGSSISRTERLIRGFGLDKPKPKYNPLDFKSDYVPVAMSKRSAARCHMGIEDTEDEEIETNGTARKRRKRGDVDRSYRPDPRFDEDDEEYELEMVPQKRAKSHGMPAPRLSAGKADSNNNPFGALREGDSLFDDEEELLEDDDKQDHYYHNGVDEDTEELVEEDSDLLEKEDGEEEVLEEDKDGYDNGYLRPGSQPYDDAPTPATQVSHVSSGPGATKEDAIALSDSD